MMRRFLLTFSLLALCLFAVAQQPLLSGFVFERTPSGNTPLTGAGVQWMGTLQGTATDVDGAFSLPYVEGGVLIVSFVGYLNDTISIHSVEPLTVYLKPEEEEMDEVEVVRRRFSTITNTRSPLVEQTITGAELCKAACCNLGESFETNASVDVSYSDAVTGAKQIQLLGLTGRYVQMLTENMPNFRGMASLYGLSYVPGPWMSAISISKGTGSVINGYESIAGQISVDYKKPRDLEHYSANLFYSDEGMVELNANASLQFNDRLSTMLLVHGDYLNVENDHNGDGFLDMPRKQQMNLFNRWAYKTDEIYIQGGVKYLGEKRLGGQSSRVETYNPYLIVSNTDHLEAFGKVGFLMPQDSLTSVALVANFVNHRQDNRFGTDDRKRIYNGAQSSLFVNLIYQSAFSKNHLFSAGAGYAMDMYKARYASPAFFTTAVASDIELDRFENVPGAFFQYTGHFFDNKFTAMAGVRYDYNALYHESVITPRVHVVFLPWELTALKVTFGTGRRSPEIFSDNMSLMAANRDFVVNNASTSRGTEAVSDAYLDLGMEKAWNVGLNFSHKMEVLGRLMTLMADYYHTSFASQVLADDESISGSTHFYAIGSDYGSLSYSNCYQAEISWEPIPRLTTLFAFRYNDVWQTYGETLKRAPLQGRYKGLINLSYFTRLKKWQADFTMQFNGGGEYAVPDPESLAFLPSMVRTEFDPYQIINAQITRYFRHGSIYIGGENLTNFRQMNPILDAENPSSRFFDATKVWGPIHGRKFYIGLRYAINRE